MKPALLHRRCPARARGYVLVTLLVLTSVVSLTIVSIIGWGVMNYKAGLLAVERERSLQLAEAGIEYYRWHLAHAPTDYSDGTGEAGPFRHEFLDKDGNRVGSFSLAVTAPSIGSSEVAIVSSGDTGSKFSPERRIRSTLMKPSFARYAVAANDEMRFGEGTAVYGPVHSNKGIRFDGVAYGLVTSAVASYYDPDHYGAAEYGVHTHAAGNTDPLPPFAAPTRPDVFKVGRQFPVAGIDFDGMTADFAQMKADASLDGFYRPSAGALGYHVVLRTDHTFDLYKATKLYSQSGCYNSSDQDDWGTWSIAAEHFVGNFAMPHNGLIFLEDDVFVDGQVNGDRVTVVAAFLPDNAHQRKNVIVNRSLLYTTYDGRDSVGLIAQGNVITGLVSDNKLRIDAALIAQKGKVGRFYYDAGCAPYHRRDTVTLWGMIATAVRYGYAYTDNTGYAYRNLNYDGNLFFSPPPSFPLTADRYVTTSWGEQ